MASDGDPAADGTRPAAMAFLPGPEGRDGGSWIVLPVGDAGSSRGTAARDDPGAVAVGIARREELRRRMAPEQRARFERIAALREKIGPVGFDVVAALRELRGDG